MLLLVTVDYPTAHPYHSSRNGASDTTEPSWAYCFHKEVPTGLPPTTLQRTPIMNSRTGVSDTAEPLRAYCFHKKVPADFYCFIS